MYSETGGLFPKPEVRWISNSFNKNDKVEGIVIENPSSLLQISAVRLNQQTLEEEKVFDTLVGPPAGVSVEEYLDKCNPKALAVNKIGERKEELKNSPPLNEAISLFLNWLPSRYLICGQNVQFDLNFFNAKLETLGRDERFYGQPLEILAFSRLYFALPDTPIVANYRLETIAAALGIETEGAHDSLVDCQITAKVMRKMFKRFSLK
jgi:DNA polymerase III epsilon subunit-like protein